MKKRLEERDNVLKNDINTTIFKELIPQNQFYAYPRYK